MRLVLRQKVRVHLLAVRMTRQSFLIDVRGGLEPQATQIRVDLLDRDPVEGRGGERRLGDDGVVDVRCGRGEVVEVREGVEDVEARGFEGLEVVLGEVVGERGELLVLREVGLLVRRGGDTFDLGELGNECCGYKVRR